MSFLRTIAIRAPRAPLAATASTKRVHFSTSPYVQKDSASAVKDTIDSVNKSVGDAAAKGIEKGRQATEALKSTVGINAKHAEGSAKKMTREAKGKGSEMTGEAKGKGSEMTGEAKSKSSEMTGEAKGKGSEMAGKAQEMAGEAKGKAQEVAGQAKGKAEEVKGKM